MSDAGLQAYSETITKNSNKYRDAILDLQDELIKERK